MLKTPQQFTVTPARFGHAVVIGSSVAGLTAARILADHFDRVTVVERDVWPAAPDFRPGVPQARHAHLLLKRGQLILEKQFPGLIEDLTARGASLIDAKSTAYSADGVQYDFVDSLACSRPLLESVIFERLSRQPNVRFIQNHDVLGLEVSPHGRQVTGVRLRRRSDWSRFESRLAAELVVDASGRGSKAPQWLAELGYIPPRETTVSAFSGYTSRIYQRPAGMKAGWTMMRIDRTPPDQTRGGMILPLEGNRWHVTVVGMGRDYPPADEAGFLAFARSLPNPSLVEAIQAAEPLTELYSFRGTQNRLRHYEKLPRYLEGLLVCGDAACSLSPVYAMGMTAAAIGSRSLATCLAEQPVGSVTGLARRFQQQLHRDIAPVWRAVTGSDQLWPATETAIGQQSVRREISRERQPTIPLGFSLAFR